MITPPIILGGAGGANFTTDVQQYLVSTSLIVCGILSSIQITRFHIKGTPYFIGTGLISVVGVSFATIPVASGALTQMYATGMYQTGFCLIGAARDKLTYSTGFCPTDAAGNKLPCPKGYGKFIENGVVFQRC